MADLLGMLGTLGAAGLSSAASVYNNSQNIRYTEEANDAMVALANTAHQREVRDFEAAGLNPILSASSSGSSTPSLRTPSLEGIDGGIGQSSGSLSRALNGIASSEVKMAKADASSAQAYARQAGRLASAEREQAELDLDLARLHADARRDALEGTYSLEHYQGKDGVYSDLVDLYRNEIKSGKYKSSLGHAIFDDVLSGASSASDLVSVAKGIKGMLPQKQYRDVKSVRYLRDAKGRVIDKTTNRRRLPQ